MHLSSNLNSRPTFVQPFYGWLSVFGRLSPWTIMLVAGLGRSVCPVNYRGGRVPRLGCFAASSCRLPCCLAGMAGDAEDSVLIPCASTYPAILFAKWPMLPSNPCPLHRLARIIALLWHLERKLLSIYAGSTNGKSFV